MVRIISAFPGTGKTFFCENVNPKALGIRFSEYAWISRGTRNLDFPKNYIEKIKNSMRESELILVSSHAEVVKGLLREKLDFTLVFPSMNLKEEYLRRIKQRGDSEEYVELLSKNWESWVGELESQKDCVKIKLSAGQYLADVL